MLKPSKKELNITSFAANRKVILFLYGFAVFFYWISMYLYVPTLPIYAQTKTSNLAMIGIVLAQYGLWQAVIRLPLGIVADWLGWRKPFIIVGFLLAAVGAWMMGYAGSIDMMVVGRAVTGFAAATWVLLVVAFSGLFPPEEAVRATAILTLVNSVGRMLATGVTGFLNDYGGYTLAFDLALVAAILALAAVLVVPEKRRIPKAPTVSSIGRLVLRRDVLVPSLLSAILQYASWASTFGFIPILAKDLGANDVLQGLLTSMNIGVMTIGNLMATTIVKRIGPRNMVYISFAMMSGGILIAATANVLWLVFAAQIFTGLASGIGYPVLMGMSIQKVGEQERATAMGLHQAVYAIGMFSGPWLSGILARAYGTQPMFGFTAIATFIIGIIGTRWLLSKQKA
jgi:MFS family permease